MGDFKIDLKSKGIGLNKIDEFCDLFNVTNLIVSETCFTNSHKCLIDLFLTNKPSFFQKMHVTKEVWVIITIWSPHFLNLTLQDQDLKLLLTAITKKFYENVFLNDLHKLYIKLDEENPESSYSLTSNKTYFVKEENFKSQLLSLCKQTISKIHLYKKQIEKQDEFKSFQRKCIGM